MNVTYYLIICLLKIVTPVLFTLLNDKSSVLKNSVFL